MINSQPSHNLNTQQRKPDTGGYADIVGIAAIEFLAKKGRHLDAGLHCMFCCPERENPSPDFNQG